MRVSNSYGDPNSHADCKSISNRDSYVYAYPDSSGHSYTYSSGFGYAYRHSNAKLLAGLRIHIGHRNDHTGSHRHRQPLR
jgi:hypothetical protein